VHRFLPQDYVVFANFVNRKLQDCNLHLTIVQPLPDGPAQMDPDLKADAGVSPAEPGKHVCQISAVEILVCADPDNALEIRSCQVADRLIVGFNNTSRVTEEILTVRGGFHVPAALDQLKPNPLLQPLDLPADRALGKAKAACGTGEPTGLDHNLQAPQRFNVQSHS
jgi:hypothetical protein